MMISSRYMRSTARRMTSIGQGLPAMMPVRRLDRSNLPNSGWSISAMNIVGTPCTAVQRSASSASSVQRIEALARIDHRRAVRQATEIADHHPEAVIERHRDAHPVVLGQLHRFADEKAVIENVVVAKRGTLWEPGSAAGELDIDRVVELQFFFERGKMRPRRRARQARNFVKPHHSGHDSLADHDKVPQLRQSRHHFA